MFVKIKNKLYNILNMSDKIVIKSLSKPKINLNTKEIKTNPKKKFNSLTPNKCINKKDGIIYNEKIDDNKNKVFAPHHNNYHINNNISININIDIDKNKTKQIKTIKNKTLVKNQPIPIKNEEIKNTNRLIFNTLKYYTNKNNLNKSPSNIGLKSANIGIKELKYNSNNKLNKNINNTNAKKNLI